MNSTTTSNASAASTQIGNMSMHVPFPQDLGIECEKAREIINEFAKTLVTSSDSQTIPPQAFIAAKGIVVISVLKIGAGWSGRIGSGLVVAKLPDGRWSAPSSVALIGAGYGPQFGAAITDFVYVLTSDEALRSFTQTGQLTLGAQFSMAAGSNSKSMETSAVLSKGQTPVGISPGYCYAKSKGLFVGVSLEGSIITTRKEANEKFYHEKGLSPAQLLGSALEPAAAAETLYNALNSATATAHEALQQAASMSQNYVPPPPAQYSPPQGDLEGYNVQPSAPPQQQNTTPSLYPDIPSLPIREEASSASANTFQPIAIALYDFEAQRPTDLSFKKGDVITIVSRSDTVNDWWVGRLNGREGRFPANRTKVEGSS
ncbi:hypothetical protein HK098_003717 [Nowakowskiella sp. JEL0407]|nr:hypothetical protein HK098_003717 [Nowakowskiella sp. JEL0407]